MSVTFQWVENLQVTHHDTTQDFQFCIGVTLKGLNFLEFPFGFFCLLLLHVPILDFLYELQCLVVPLHFIDVQGQVLGKTDRLGQPLQKTPSHLHTDYATEGVLLVSDPVYPKTGQHARSLSGTLPPNSAVTGYATEGVLLVSAHVYKITPKRLMESAPFPKL